MILPMGSIGMIVTINLIVQILLVSLVKWTGLKTLSAQTMGIKNGIFFAQFFNTGIILLVSNADFHDLGLDTGYF